MSAIKGVPAPEGLSRSILEDRFFYDPESGKLLYKTRPSCKNKIGDEAGTTNHAGYRVVMINGKLYSCHRLVFFLHHDWWPELVDHINRDRADNRIENLRPSNKSLNALNSVLHGRRRKVRE